jgi:hypothetical protein
MTLHDYSVSRELERADHPFYGLVMAAMRRADTDNLAKLIYAWPEVYAELDARYNAPGARLPDDPQPAQ